MGKVGTESPAFIQPITERKDGIRAMFAKQEKKAPSPSKPPAPASEQAQPETQPQLGSPGKSQFSSEFPTTPVGKRKASALEDSIVKKAQGSPAKKPRLGSASPRKGGSSPTVSKRLSHATSRTHPRLPETEEWTDVKHHRFLRKENPFMMVRHPFVCAVLFMWLVPFAPQSHVVFECNP